MTTTPALGTDPTSLATHGISAPRAWANLRSPELYEHALRRGEGHLTSHGALVVLTTPHTGRSPNDKFTVDEPGSHEKIWWDKNKAMTEAHFDALLGDVHLPRQLQAEVDELGDVRAAEVVELAAHAATSMPVVA